jgi:hypothetical protein
MQRELAILSQCCQNNEMQETVIGAKRSKNKGETTHKKIFLEKV